MAIMLYKNPDGTIGADGAGNPMEITQAEFEDCCCGVPGSCPCDVADWQDMANGVTPSCDSLVRCYRIKNYADGDIKACIAAPFSCPAPDPAAIVWDGTFYAFPGIRCRWYTHWGATRLKIDVPVDQRWLHESSRITLIGGVKWQIYIQCSNVIWLWVGEKVIGTTPVGIYNRTASDCPVGQPGAIELEECP